MSSEPTKSLGELFYEKRAERLKLLDNGAKVCQLNLLSPTVEQLEEAIQIGHELLENLHQNNVKERLCDLMEKAMALIEREKDDE